MKLYEMANATKQSKQINIHSWLLGHIESRYRYVPRCRYRYIYRRECPDTDT